MRLVVRAAKRGLKGTVDVPPSKSHTLRAAIFATLAQGESRILHPLDSPDADACLRACEMLGARVSRGKDAWRIVGTGGALTAPDDVIDVGNSGIALRFVSAMAAACTGFTVVTGDESIRSQRAMGPLLEAIEGWGGSARSTRGSGLAPVIVRGPLAGGSVEIDGQDSQHVSGALIASLACEGPAQLHVREPGETPWVDMTLWWFARLGLRCEREGHTRYDLPGRQRVGSFELRVPADFSSAAFPLVAAMIVPGSSVELRGLAMDDPQGDKDVLATLARMGARIAHEPGGITRVQSSGIAGQEIDVNPFIDAVPILSVAGCFAQGTTRLSNAAIARGKESDRLHAMAAELRKMGASIEELPDGLVIGQSALRGTRVDAHKDHRVAMSLAIAGLAAHGETVIEGAECIAKTYKGFAQAMRAIGADIREEPEEGDA